MVALFEASGNRCESQEFRTKEHWLSAKTGRDATF
jgi:hypothetical protein